MARLKALAASHSAASKLGVQIGDANWLVDLTDVSEVLPVPSIATVPLTQRWFRGVANIRGNLFSVVDLPGFLGGDSTPATTSARLLLIHSRHILNSALLVNRMLGLRSLEGMKEIAGANPDQSWTGVVWRDESGKEWRELRIGELVQQAAFIQVGTV